MLSSVDCMYVCTAMPLLITTLMRTSDVFPLTVSIAMMVVLGLHWFSPDSVSNDFDFSHMVQPNQNSIV